MNDVRKLKPDERRLVGCVAKDERVSKRINKCGTNLNMRDTKWQRHRVMGLEKKSKQSRK